MQDAELIEFLKKTLEDGKVSRGERSTLRDAFEGMADHRRAKIRDRIFEMARERAAAATGLVAAFAWLESVVDLLAVERPSEAATSVAAWFTPGHDGGLQIASLFDRARRSVDVCVYTITDDRIARAILAAHERRVRVRIVSDNEKSGDLGSDVDRLAEAGVPLGVDTSPYHMHHKFAIFDGRQLLNGSFNWTRSASTSNEENLILLDDLRLVALFQREFDRLWSQYGAS